MLLGTLIKTLLGLFFEVFTQPGTKHHLFKLIFVELALNHTETQTTKDNSVYRWPPTVTNKGGDVTSRSLAAGSRFLASCETNILFLNYCRKKKKINNLVVVTSLCSLKSMDFH